METTEQPTAVNRKAQLKHVMTIASKRATRAVNRDLQTINMVRDMLMVATTQLVTVELMVEDAHGALIGAMPPGGGESMKLADYDVCREPMQQKMHAIPSALRRATAAIQEIHAIMEMLEY